MPQSKKGPSKAKSPKKTTSSKKQDVHASSSDDEVVLTKKKLVSNKEKSKSSSRPKDGKKTVSDNHYTPIVEQCYQCFTLSTVPADMHRVSIDVHTLLCQLFELWCVRSKTTNNYSVCMQYLVRFKACLLGVILNIAKGCRFSDIPTQVVDCITRSAVSVHKDDLDVLHMCSIPKGRVFVSRGNRSLAVLAAIIDKIPSELNEQTLAAFNESMSVYLNSKGIDRYVVSPPEGQDEALAKSVKELGQHIISSDWFNLHLRQEIMALNASVVENQDFVLYQPVVCNLEDVAYVENRGHDNVLVTFSDVSNENVLKRLRISSYGIRFFVNFMRIQRQNKVFIDSWQVDSELAEAGYVAVLEKYKIVKVWKKMDEDASIVEDIQPREKKEAKEVKDIQKWEKPDDSYKQLVAGHNCVTLEELRTAAKEGREVRVTSTKIIVIKDPNGDTGTSALVAEAHKVPRSGSQMCYYLALGTYQGGEFTTGWYSLATPEDVTALAQHIPKLQ